MDNRQLNAVVMQHDMLCTHVTFRIIDAEIQCFDAQPVFLAPEQRFIAIEHRRAARAQAFQNFQLRIADALARAEKFDVCRADIGNDGDIRLCLHSHAGNFLEIRHAHFHNCRLCVFLQTEQRQRHADFIVQIALCIDGIELLREHCCRHFLGCRLADRTGDADNRDVKQAAIAACQCQQRAARIIHADHRNRKVDIALGHDCRCLCFNCLFQKIVPVEAFTAQRDEQASRRNRPRISRNACDACIAVSDDRTAHECGSLRHRNCLHNSDSPLIVLLPPREYYFFFSKYSATTSRSSRWCLTWLIS